MDKKLALFSYGVIGFSDCYNKTTMQIEDDLLIMFYGNNKKFVFPKNSAYDLIKAINGKYNVNGTEYTKENFDFELKFFKMDIIAVLNSRLKGKGFIMITKFKNPVEYINGCQNEYVGITGMDLDGNLFAKSPKKLFKQGFASYDVDNYSKPPKEVTEKTTFDA